LLGAVVDGVGVGLADTAVGGRAVGGTPVGGAEVGVGVGFDPQAERKKINNKLVRNNFFIICLLLWLLFVCPWVCVWSLTSFQNIII
jgi:hypothetical protein